MYHAKKDKRSQVSCKLISGALVKLISQHSFEDINIKMLVEMAGVGRATFYRSFDSIDDVLKYQTDIVIRESVASIYSELTSRSVVSEDEIFSSFFKFWFQHVELIGTLIMAKRYWLLENSFDDLFKTKLVIIKKLLNMQDDTWRYFIRIRTAMLTRMLAEWFVSGKKETPDELVNILLKSFAHVTINISKLSLD